MTPVIYETLTGRKLNLNQITKSERSFLAVILGEYKKHPGWGDFSGWWPQYFSEAGLQPGTAVYRVCQDLEARLGISQKKLATPDYRDYLADLVEERFGSRYKFCKATGVDPGQLSRVFSSRSDLSLQALQTILKSLGASLVIQSTESVNQSASPERAEQALELAAAGG